MTSIKSVEVKGVNNSSSYIQIDAFEVNNAILVDAGAQWNTSQVWSDNTIGNFASSLPATNMFDGVINDTNRAAAATAAAVVFTNLTVNSSLRIYTFSNTAGALTATLGGTDVDVTFGSDYEWRTVSLPATPVSFDKLTFVNNASGVAGIEVDGALLVDGTAVWNTSQVWSSDNENWDAAAPAENFFDGSLNTEAYAASGQSATVTFDAVTATSSIELYCKGQGGVQPWYATVDGVEKRLTVADEYGWVSVPGISYPADLTAIRHSQQTGGIKAVKVDGALLVNGAYTWNSSQVWSDGVTRQQIRLSQPATPLMATLQHMQNLLLAR